MNSHELLVDKLARLFVFTRAMQSAEILRQFDRLTGASLAEHPEELLRVVDSESHSDGSPAARFREFAEERLWDRAPESARAAIRSLVNKALNARDERGPLPLFH